MNSLLKRIESFVRTDVAYLTSGFSWLSFSLFVSTISGVLLAVVFGTFFPQEAYGEYKFILSLFAIASIFSLNSMNVSIVRSVAQFGPRAFLKGFIAFAKSSILIGIVCFGIAAYYYLVLGEKNIATMMLIAGVLGPFYQSFSLYPSLFAGQKKWKLSALYAIPQTIVPAIALGIAVYINANPILIVAIYFLGNTLTSAVLFARAMQTTKGADSATKDSSDVVHFGSHLSFMRVLEKLSNEIDKVLLFSMLGPAALGVYSFARLPVNQIRSIGGILRNLLLPKLSTKDPAILQKTIDRKAIILFFFLLPIAFAYYLAAPFIFNYLFPLYTDSVEYTRLLAVSILFLPTVLYRQSLIAQGKKASLYIINNSVAILRIVLLAILLPLYGISGAVYAVLITGAINFSLSVVFFKRM